MKEILKARIVQPDLFKTCLTSGWAILYQANSTKLKVIKNIKDSSINPLLSLSDDCKKEYLEYDYDKIVANGRDVVELDYSNWKIRKNLTEQEYLAHPLWRCVFDEDESLMKEYFQAFLNYSKNNVGFVVYLRSAVTISHLHPFLVGKGYIYESYLYADNNIDSSNHFLFKMPKQ